MQPIEAKVTMGAAHDLALKGRYTLTMGAAHRRKSKSIELALKGRNILTMGEAHRKKSNLQSTKK